MRVYGLDLGPPIRILVTGPLYHSVPNAYARLGLRVEADIVLQPKFEAEGFLELVERHRITHAHMVPGDVCAAVAAGCGGGKVAV